MRGAAVEARCGARGGAREPTASTSGRGVACAAPAARGAALPKIPTRRVPSRNTASRRRWSASRDAPNAAARAGWAGVAPRGWLARGGPVATCVTGGLCSGRRRSAPGPGPPLARAARGTDAASLAPRAPPALPCPGAAESTLPRRWPRAARARAQRRARCCRRPPGPAASRCGIAAALRTRRERCWRGTAGARGLAGRWSFLPC